MLTCACVATATRKNAIDIFIISKLAQESFTSNCKKMDRVEIENNVVKRCHSKAGSR